MPNVQPFMHFLDEALRQLRDAHQRDHLEYLRIQDGGVLRGYYLAGVVCKVEYDAAVRRLQEAYETKLGLRAHADLPAWVRVAEVES